MADVCVHARKGLALPRTSHSGEIIPSGLRRLRSTLAATLVLFAHAAVTEASVMTAEAVRKQKADDLKRERIKQRRLKMAIYKNAGYALAIR